MRRLISRVIKIYIKYSGRSRPQWPSFLRRRSAAARLLRLWVRIPPGHGCLSVVSVVFYQVEVPATSLSLIQWSPTDCGASLFVCVRSRNLVKEEALAHWRHLGQNEKIGAECSSGKCLRGRQLYPTEPTVCTVVFCLPEKGEKASFQTLIIDKFM